MSLTRRALLGILGAAGIAKAGSENRAPRSCQRRYRASAVILLCGVPIFSKRGVGAGYASIDESRDENLTTYTLRFAGGSWPDKVHGLNRLGMIEETVVENRAGEPLEANYFGFMTSAAEKNLDQAKQSFAASPGAMANYTATEGVVRDGRFRFHTLHFQFPARYTWADRARLREEVRASMGDAGNTSRDLSDKTNTFLNAVRHALSNSSKTTAEMLIYSGKLYRLTTDKQPENDSVMRLNGMLEEEATGQRTPFKIWFEKDAASILPLRIEYKAKPFLKLIFEYDPEVAS